MGRDHRTPQEREAAFRSWWNGLSPESQRAEIKAGHVRVRLPESDAKQLTQNQRKADRRRAKGKR